MGCDIHTVVQQKIDGEWRDFALQPGLWRNYTVFTVLAGVRNEHKRVPRISDPRGLPTDFPKTHSSDPLCPDYHTHSWLLLSEIISYDWCQTLHVTGYVDLENFKTWDETGRPPQTWCQGAWGVSIEDCTHEMMRKRMTSPGPKANPMTWITWAVPVGEYCEEFLQIVEHFKKLGDVSRFRLVFWFDN